jgi:predicted nucleic acid-binding protein
MTGKHFVDSNILIYAHDADVGERQRRSARILECYGSPAW